MRYQSRIYAQEPISCIRNKDHINVVMSSDICVFKRPILDIDGADKIASGMTITDDSVHITSPSDSTIPLTFIFTDNEESFDDINLTFKYKVYKYSTLTGEFTSSSLFTSSNFSSSDLGGSNSFIDEVPLNNLYLDGEYLVKCSYDFTMCTDYMNKLSERIDTSIPLIGDEYGIYEPEFDFYFIAFSQSTTPTFSLSQEDTRTLGALVVENFILDDGETEITTVNSWVGSPIVSLNGITLANTEDFTYSSNTITLLGDVYEDDILSVAYVNNGNPNGLLSESIVVDGVIVSGSTGGQGSEPIYYDTDLGKYQVFTATDPVEFNDLILTLNGVTLANGLDYYQLSGSPRTIVLNGSVYSSGDLGDGNEGGLADIITLIYNSYGTYAGIIQVETFDVNWSVYPAPTSTSGYFTFEIAEDETFSNIIFTGDVQYVENQSLYSITADVTGYGDGSAAYRVQNNKLYTTLEGDELISRTDSEIIPIEINL